MILFFDTFIINSKLDDISGSTGDIKRKKITQYFRDNNNNYRYQEKIDVVKYTLISYSKIAWQEVIIRFECEDKTLISDFCNFCKCLFPNAFIENIRSDTAKKYIDALQKIKKKNNPWVFFSPNNDHVNLVDNHLYETIIKDAEIAEKKFSNYPVSIGYSHYPELINSYSITKPIWGNYGRNFSKKIYKTNNSIFVLDSRLTIDSIKIFRLNFLLKIFDNQDKKRIIRQEDTNKYLIKEKLITIVPKVELCRHYDGYPLSFMDPPPLFIPPGFFDSKIRVKYMFDHYDADCVNINPTGEYIFNKGNCDLKTLLEDLPFFWKERVCDIEINEKKNFDDISFDDISKKDSLPYYKNLNNPWNKMPLFLYFILPILRILGKERLANKINYFFTYKIK
jgi:hypothetical protein